jgi:hypothetical protein
VIDVDFQQKVENVEPLAPKRLTRKDVAEVRALFVEAKRAYPSLAWNAKRTLWLDRGKGERAAARLGRPAPCVVIVATWSKNHEVGLDVKVTAHAAIGASDDWKIRVGTHRFRNATSVQQFAREVSHLVRLGLGWAKNENTRLARIFR